jgi:hypothetical protein
MADCIACGAATPNPLCAAFPTPWATPPSLGFVGIIGGGEHYLPFHQPHSDNFMPDTNHQQIWLIELPVVLPPPIRFVPLHPNTMGDAPHVQFCRNQWWGRVIGRVLPQLMKLFWLYTWQSTGLQLIALPVALSPPICFVLLYPNTMGDSPASAVALGKCSKNGGFGFIPLATYELGWGKQLSLQKLIFQ